MDKLSRKINQSRIAILRKQLKRVNHMEHGIRKTWMPVYSQDHKHAGKPGLVGYEKYTPAALRRFRQEYWNTNGYGGVQFLDSVKVMRDLANRGDKWLLKAFNKVFYAFKGYRHGMLIIDVWKHSDRDGLLKALHPLVHQVDMSRLTEANLPTYKRQLIAGEVMFPTVLVSPSDIDNRPMFINDGPIQDVHIADYMPGGARRGKNYDLKGVDLKIAHKPFPPLPDDGGVIITGPGLHSASITGPGLHFNTSTHNHPADGKVIAQGSNDRE